MHTIGRGREGGQAGAVRRVHAARQHLHLRAPRHLRGSCEFELSGNSTPCVAIPTRSATRAAWYAAGAWCTGHCTSHGGMCAGVSAAKSAGRLRRRAACARVCPPARPAGRRHGLGADETSARMSTQTQSQRRAGCGRSHRLAPARAGGREGG
jgi:hypothetical protein